MNRYREDYEYIRAGFSNGVYDGSNHVAESMLSLEFLVERATPKRIIMPTENITRKPLCPICEYRLCQYEKDKFCSHCGQALDWNK